MYQLNCCVQEKYTLCYLICMANVSEINASPFVRQFPTPVSELCAMAFRSYDDVNK